MATKYASVQLSLGVSGVGEWTKFYCSLVPVHWPITGDQMDATFDWSVDRVAADWRAAILFLHSSKGAHVWDDLFNLFGPYCTEKR